MLFWTRDERDARFGALETLAPHRTISAGNAPSVLPRGTALVDPAMLGSYMAHQRSAGVIILVDGVVRDEAYALGHGPDRRWTSFSVAKSITATLAGIAVAEGAIGSLDDPVTRYVPTLAGDSADTGYAGISVRDILTMRSGIAWDEDYTNPASDVSRFVMHVPDDGIDASVSYMRRLKRAGPAGRDFVYKTGETNLLGVIVSAATGMTLSDYLSARIWQPCGMAGDAIWLTGATGHEIAGCCISARLSDYARFGQFICDAGMIGDRQVVDRAYLDAALSVQTPTGRQPPGYGYQWWVRADGSAAAQGIFGQGILVDRQRRLVIASNGNWPTATDPDGLEPGREAFYRAAQAAVDAERAIGNARVSP